MTLVTLTSPIVWPNLPSSSTTLAAIGSDTTIDAAGEYIALVFQATEAMTISHVGFRAGTVAGSGTADIRIETVGADGNPSGSLWAANTNIAGGALSTNTWTLQALTASASIAVGEWAALVIKYNSGTSFQNSRLNNSGWYNLHSSYRVVNTGTPTQSAIGQPILAVVGSGATTFYAVDGMVPFTTATSTDFNSGSGTIRYGIRFKLPFKCRPRGFSFASAQTGDFTAAIYNDAGTSLIDLAIDGNNMINGYAGKIVDGNTTLDANTWYRAAVEATTVTNQEVLTFTMPSADYISGTPWGANAHLTTWNGSAWDDTNTSILPLMAIVIDQIDDGTGSGAAAVTRAYAFS